MDASITLAEDWGERPQVSWDQWELRGLGGRQPQHVHCQVSNFSRGSCSVVLWVHSSAAYPGFQDGLWVSQSGPRYVFSCQMQSFPHSSDHRKMSCACTEVMSVTPDMPISGSLWDTGGQFSFAQPMGNWQCHSVHPWFSSPLISSHGPCRPIE